MLDELIEHLHTRTPRLVGCVRRNRLEDEHAQPPYRYLRGNAPLALLGERVTLSDPVGEPFDVFIRQTDDGPVLLQFRGGERKPWWDEDIRLLLAVLLEIGTPAREAFVVGEVDGLLYSYTVPCPTEALAKSLVAGAVDRWAKERRIPKDSARGRAVCRYCPVKRECDRMDMERGETHDWPEDYQVG